VLTCHSMHSLLRFPARCYVSLHSGLSQVVFAGGSVSGVSGGDAGDGDRLFRFRAAASSCICSTVSAVNKTILATYGCSGYENGSSKNDATQTYKHTYKTLHPQHNYHTPWHVQALPDMRVAPLCRCRSSHLTTPVRTGPEEAHRHRSPVTPRPDRTHGPVRPNSRRTAESALLSASHRLPPRSPPCPRTHALVRAASSTEPRTAAPPTPVKQRRRSRAVCPPRNLPRVPDRGALMTLAPLKIKAEG
jgi:hypothetical protein